MLTEERHQQILEELKHFPTVQVQELVDRLRVSESTIRRDLSILESKGQLIRVHGGAKRLFGLTDEPTMGEKASHYRQEKQRIAQAAAQLVQDNDVIYLDAGTTTLEMIPYLPENLKVVTNGLAQADELSRRGFETVLIGGWIKKGTQAIIGSQAIRQLSDYRFDKAFMGMNGVDENYGLTTPDVEEASIKKLAIRQAARSYVLADKSKFDCVSFCHVADVEDVTIITDLRADESLRALAKRTTIKEV
ncbi:DeoR/GlpR transcriptional regulator [Atopobacter sp. AH10]|uniref:DeoR/GlpR family DNA-binding transcription regulator n=1 Tax=Atopobacter sp. AH10 TaxID=2315861 RepID=UPI000EF1EFCA|nr:DeoR/GlpR family DNA-binding transcription regulator [Atopobacter sp. AH10]RLK62915.1 DeoR/GlpR transcriptional regulator [Atopobacter sp. AH10]